MESGTPTTDTSESDSVGQPLSYGASADAQLAPLSISREQCSRCGAVLAADQRYCVDCGQRSGVAPRLPFTEGIARGTVQSPSAPARSRRRPRASVNSTVIAGIGTLLLAMGVGVLIGHLGTASNAKVASPAVQVVTVPGAGSTASTGTEAQSATSAAGATKTTGAASGAASAGAAKKSASHASKKAAAAPPAKTVTVGSPGKGPGYKNGHFTGNFFGE